MSLINGSARTAYLLTDLLKKLVSQRNIRNWRIFYGHGNSDINLVFSRSGLIMLLVITKPKISIYLVSNIHLPGLNVNLAFRRHFNTKSNLVSISNSVVRFEHPIVQSNSWPSYLVFLLVLVLVIETIQVLQLSQIAVLSAMMKMVFSLDSFASSRSERLEFLKHTW